MLSDCAIFPPFEPLFFDPGRHGQSLAALACASLASAQKERAFAFADRRCRLPAPTGGDFLLRALAERAAGSDRRAAQDLRRAFEIAPNDESVLFCALNWGDRDLRLGAAAALIDGDNEDPSALGAALDALREAGTPLAARLRAEAQGLAGWAAWNAERRLEIAIGDRPAKRVEPDLGHALSGRGWRAADLAIEAADAGSRVVLSLDGEAVRSFGAPRRTRRFWAAPKRDAVAGAVAVNVIVPIYEDFEATTACLEALLSEGSAARKRIIVVDDASPNGALCKWLLERSAAGAFELIRNETNLGFAASINRALALCERADALLLNSDAFLSPLAIDRLAAVARSGEDIATVTPISNNGELTSFPLPNVANPIPDERLRAEIAEAAFAANATSRVDLPNGVGFCLYVTRACLDRVGAMPELYARGYYEDVEFCLRAREAGMRNVCATGVYVAHAGSRSFGGEKRALVLRNLAILESRFPRHVRECAAFLDMDPLSEARAAIQARLAPAKDALLMVAPEGPALRQAQQRAREILRRDPSASVLIGAVTQGGKRVVFRVAGAGAPHAAALSLDDAMSQVALRDYLERLRPQLVELFAPLDIPDVLFDELMATPARRRLVVADLRWFSARPLALEKSCRDRARPGECAGCRGPRPEADDARRARRLAESLRGADELLAPDVMAAAFAERHLPALPIVESAPARSRRPAGTATGTSTLGVLAPYPTGESDRLIEAIARRLLIDGAGNLVVLGSCHDDLAAMAAGNVFVTGPIDDDEASPALLSFYGVSRLLSPYRCHGFGRLDAIARRAGLPMAYFDWSFGALTAATGDLSMDPRVCHEAAARALASWLLQTQRSEAVA
jgi:GT2 family glycosyltransferase